MTQGSPSGLAVSIPSELEIVMTRAFAAPIALVFEAITKPEHIRRWLGRSGDVMTVCDVDLRVGGKWRYVWTLREGGEMGMSGEFLEVVVPELLVTTEAFDEPYFEVMGAGTINTLRLEEREGRTFLTTTVRYKSRQARDTALGTDMETGAAESYDRLAELLKTLA